MKRCQISMFDALFGRFNWRENKKKITKSGVVAPNYYYFFLFSFVFFCFVFFSVVVCFVFVFVVVVVFFALAERCLNLKKVLHTGRLTSRLKRMYRR